MAATAGARKGNHQRRLASVGDSSSLFGAADDGDFFNALGAAAPAAAPAQGTPFDQGIATVLEEEEPLSPQLGSSSALFGGSVFPDVEGDDGSSDWLNGGGQQAEQQYGSDQVSGGHSVQGSTGYDYPQDHAQNSYTSSTDYASHDAAANPYDAPTDYVEPPYYPGFYYDPASNSYLPDPNTQSNDWNDQQGGYQAEGSSQDQYAGYQPEGGEYTPQQQEGGNAGSYGGQAESWDQQQYAVQQPTYEAYHPQEAQATEEYQYGEYPPLPVSPDEGGYAQQHSYQTFAAPDSTYDAYNPASQPSETYDNQSYDPASYYNGTAPAPAQPYDAPSSYAAPQSYAPPPRAVSADYNRPVAAAVPPPPRSTTLPPPLRTASSTFPTSAQANRDTSYTGSPPTTYASPPITLSSPSYQTQPLPTSSPYGSDSPYGPPAVLPEVEAREQQEEYAASGWEPEAGDYSTQGVQGSSWDDNNDKAEDAYRHDDAAAERASNVSEDSFSDRRRIASAEGWDIDLEEESPTPDFSVDILSTTLAATSLGHTSFSHLSPIAEQVVLPELNFVAPSPDTHARHDEGLQEPSPIVLNSVAPSSIMEEEEELDEPMREEPEVEDVPPAEEYGFDESQVFDEEGGQSYGEDSRGLLSTSTSGSNYGEWTGESDAKLGYDYVSSYPGGSSEVDTTYEQTPIAPDGFQEPATDYSYAPPPTDYSYAPPESPYAAQDDPYAASDSPYAPPSLGSPYIPTPAASSSYLPPPSRAAASTPEPTHHQLDSYASPPRHAPATLYGSPSKSPTMLKRGSPSQASRIAPLRPIVAAQDPYAPVDSSQPYGASSNDSYATYPAPSRPQSRPVDDPYAAPPSAGLVAPSTYGYFSSTSAYDPYAAAPAPTMARQYSNDGTSPGSSVHGDPYSTQTNATPYDPYARPPIERNVSSSASFASNGELPDLGLARSTAPVISFGFGGRMLVVFPNGPTPSYGMNVAPYGSTPGDISSPSTVHIRKFADLHPASESTTFPGPIFMDGGRANAGKKRKEAVAWLDARIEELEQEVSFKRGGAQAGFLLSSDVQSGSETADTKRLDTRVILVKLVKILVENEGKLSGSPKIDEAVRSILVPHSSAADISDADLPLASELGLAPPITPMMTGSDSPVATYMVTPSNLDKMSAFLLRGERRKAVKYALDHQMWAHAFVISSCVDTDCWKDVVTEFLRSELSPPLDGGSAASNGREGLRVAYSMFAGLGGADSIHQFLPPRPLAAQASILPQPHLSAVLPSRAATPISPNFPETSLVGNLPESVLSNWQQTVAMIVANRTAGDSAILTALGDTLTTNGRLDAAHICYLLSPQTSPIGGVGTPSARLVLIGGVAPTSSTMAGVDLESIMLTELAEFAFSLAPTVKGQEPFAGFPHLQAFRLHHASLLADAGQVSQAQKYTDAIVGTLKLATKASPFYHPGLVAQVKLLSDRLIAAPGHDKAGSWITRKVQRPTIDSLWSGLEGRFTKFVAGEGESPATVAAKAEVAKQTSGPIGPFSHYSSISPASTSGTLSRTHSQNELGIGAAPSRVVSSSSSTTGPPPVKRAPFKTHHSRSSSLGFAGYNYDPNAPPPWQSYQPPVNGGSEASDITPTASTQEPSSEAGYGYGSAAYESGGGEAGESAGGDSGWWGSDAGGDRSGSVSTLRAPTFTPLDETFAEDESGFISPMASYTPMASPAIPTSSYAQNSQSHKRTSTRDELDDLGIGNSTARKPGFDSIDEHASEGEEGGAAPSEPQSAAAGGSSDARPTIKQSRSWLGGWFKREGTPTPGPGPVKANLGEQTSFVYDPDLKRWVNKKAGGDTATPLTTAPPPRAATASPTRAARSHMPPARYQSEAPPPLPSNGPPRAGAPYSPPSLNRAKTSADLTSDLQRAGAFRSASTGPPPMPSRPSSAAGLGPPPAGGAAAGKRKPISKRYVAIS